MTGTEHGYRVQIIWTGERGSGTGTYDGYSRDHDVAADGVVSIAASSDPAFRGDPSRWNPEMMFLASIAQCHMLWYLHLAQRAGLNVVRYRDVATATMREDRHGGGGEFTGVHLHPSVVISSGDTAQATALHHDVAKYCFIARSVRVPIDYTPEVSSAEADVQRRQAEDLPAIGLRGDDDHPGPGRRVK